MPKRTGTSPDATEPVPVSAATHAVLGQEPGPVQQGVLDAACDADWITTADQAALRLALRLAHDIDKSDDPQQIASLARTLLAVLAAIGLIVAGRTATDTKPPQQEDPLDALRARAAGRLTDAKSADTATVRSIARR